VHNKMSTVNLIILILITVIGAFIIGYLGAKFSKYLENKKISRNAKKFIAGKRKNKIELNDGRTLNVNKFITLDEKGNKYSTEFDLKGGVNVKRVENAKKEEKRNYKRKIQNRRVGIPRENRRIVREKKRTIGSRIIKRFG